MLAFQLERMISKQTLFIWSKKNENMSLNFKCKFQYIFDHKKSITQRSWIQMNNVIVKWLLSNILNAKNVNWNTFGSLNLTDKSVAFKYVSFKIAEIPVKFIKI